MAEEVDKRRRPVPWPFRPHSPLPMRDLPASVEVSVKTMGLSDGRFDYYVSLRCDGKEVTPHKFGERFKAEYHVALYDWLFNSKPEPEIMAFGPEDWPTREMPPHPLEAKLREAEWLLREACKHEGAEGFSEYLNKRLDAYEMQFPEESTDATQVQG
jgi:hypothetical protein